MMRRHSVARVDALRYRHRVRVVADRDVVLERHIKALDILAHEHQIDVIEAAARHNGADRPQVGVQPEGFAQAHIN